MSIETGQSKSGTDWTIHSEQDRELVKGLGLTSATMLVMGSMIGSGIFIVSAEIAREVNSPALLIAAWLVTGFLTITGALAYGELAAMMPHAGGQYVYLRESLGLDSVDVVGLVMRIERQYHVRLATEELAAVKSVGDLLDLLEAKLAARPDAS